MTKNYIAYCLQRYPYVFFITILVTGYLWWTTLRAASRFGYGWTLSHLLGGCVFFVSVSAFWIGWRWRGQVEIPSSAFPFLRGMLVFGILSMCSATLLVAILPNGLGLRATAGIASFLSIFFVNIGCFCLAKKK